VCLVALAQLPQHHYAAAQMTEFVPTSALININAAAPAELAQGLKGIGPSKAEAIVRYRETHGAFATLDDLVLVKGIGEKTLQKIRHLIVAGPWQAPATGESLAEIESAAKAAVQSVLRRSIDLSNAVTGRAGSTLLETYPNAGDEAASLSN